jgi:hypothetical protein
MDELTSIVTDTRRLEDLESRTDDNENYASEGIQKCKSDIISIIAKLKIQ